MSANRDLIRDLYDAFGRGDAGRVLASFDPGIVWMEAESIAYADGNPYVGPQAVAEGVFGRIMAEWEGYVIHVETLVADGDHVIAMGRYTGSYRTTGRRLDAQFVHAWTVRDGRAVRFQQYADTAQFARVTGAEGGVAAPAGAGIPGAARSAQPV